MTRRELHLENVWLADENRQLRAWLTSLIFWFAEREGLLEFGRSEIERRWPERKAA
jgi:hypothetical protein